MEELRKTYHYLSFFKKELLENTFYPTEKLLYPSTEWKSLMGRGRESVRGHHQQAPSLHLGELRRGDPSAHTTELAAPTTSKNVEEGLSFCGDS